MFIFTDVLLGKVRLMYSVTHRKYQSVVCILFSVIGLREIKVKCILAVISIL
jgi:hypothetical protein